MCHVQLPIAKRQLLSSLRPAHAPQRHNARRLQDNHLSTWLMQHRGQATYAVMSQHRETLHTGLYKGLQHTPTVSHNTEAHVSATSNAVVRPGCPPTNISPAAPPPRQKQRTCLSPTRLLLAFAALTVTTRPTIEPPGQHSHEQGALRPCLACPWKREAKSIA